MKKTGLKTFVCSFVFSLFVMFFINGLFFRTQNNNSHQIKISNKNITLFLKDERRTVASAQILPIKKIALSVVKKEIEPQKNSFDGEIIPLSHENEIEEEPVVLADNTSIIPLEISPELNKLPPPAKNNIKESPPLEKKKNIVIADYQDLIKKHPPIREDEFSINKEPVTPQADTSPQEELKPMIIKRHEPATPQKEDKLVLAYNEPKNELPQQEVQQEEDETEPQSPHNLLIPIEKNFSENISKNKIQVVKETNQKQIALAPSNIPIKSMTSDATDVPDDNSTIVVRGEAEKNKTKQWKPMSQKSKESTWSVAKGAKYPKNSMVLEEKYAHQDDAEIEKILSGDKTQPGKTVEVASETVKNLLIPIPEDILNDDNLTPQLVSSKQNKDIEEEVTRKEQIEKGTYNPNSVKKEQTEVTEKTAATGKTGIISSLTSIFSGTPPPASDGTPSQGSNLFGSIKRTLSGKNAPSRILPTEIRLSFQPNRAEISGQTLRWIQAFANKTIEDDTVALEIRIDGTSSRELQQKRLNLLHNILTNKGVEYSKIKIVFTSREPNSFIIRTIRINNNMTGDINGNNIVKQNNYYMQW